MGETGKAIAEMTGAVAEIISAGAETISAGAEITGAVASMTGAGAKMISAGAETTSATAEMTGAGAEMTGAGAEMTGAGAIMTGAGAETIPAGAPATSAGAEMTGADAPVIFAVAPVASAGAEITGAGAFPASATPPTTGLTGFGTADNCQADIRWCFIELAIDEPLPYHCRDGYDYSPYSETNDRCISPRGRRLLPMNHPSGNYGDPDSIYGEIYYASATPPAPMPERKKPMDHVAQNLRGLTAAEVAAKGRAAVTAAGTAEGIAILGTPAPSEKADLVAKTADLEAALADQSLKIKACETATKLAQDSLAAFELSYGRYCKLADNKCNGVASHMTTLALDVASKPLPIGALSAPAGLVATMSELFGQVDLMCEPVKGARFYIWQVCADPMTEANWRQVDVNTASKMSVTGLTSGTKYWFRVAAKGAGAQGPWSDPAQKMSP